MTTGTNDQSALVAFLKNSASYPHLVDTVTVEETHGAYVFLAGDKAYKLKKSVYFPYMDYSTLAKRQAMTAREVHLNQRTAPELYLNVQPIYQNGQSFSFKNTGDIVDYLVVMQRFNPENVLDKVAAAGKLTAATVQTLAEQAAALHKTAAIIDTIDGYDAVVSTIQGNDGQFAGHADILDRAKSERLAQASLHMAQTIKATLQQRGKNGLIRQCHGDLHLRNIALIADKPVLFDCIEFNDAFAQIDVLYDVAFLLMDLDYRGFSDYCNLVLNEYMMLTQDYEGLIAMPLFMAMRAAVRAHVNISIGKGFSDQSQAAFFYEEGRRYLDKALAYVTPKPAKVVAIGGLSGAGKSTMAKALAPHLGIAGGAIIVRSDVVRKQLAGVPLLSRLPESAYTDEMSRKVYASLLERLEILLETGYSVIVDAVFAKANERDDVQAMAAKHSVPFMGIWLEASSDVAQERIMQRTHDASDATASVREKQQHYNLGYINWQLVDADASMEETLRLVQASL